MGRPGVRKRKGGAFVACSNRMAFRSERAILERRQDVTLRCKHQAWAYLTPGWPLKAIRLQGKLDRNQRVKDLCSIRVVDVRRIKLWEIGLDDVRRQGIDNMTRVEFVKWYCDQNVNVTPCSTVTRIEFEYVDEEGNEGG